MRLKSALRRGVAAAVDNLKIDVSGKAEVDGSDDSPVDAGKAAVTVKGGHDATIELDGDNELKSGSNNAGLEKNDERSEDGKTISGTLTIKDDKGKDGSLTAEGGAGIGGKTAAIGGGLVGEIPNDALSNDDHKVTGGSLTRCDSDGKKMEDYSYDRRTPSQWEQPDDTENSDDEDGPPTLSPDSLTTAQQPEQAADPGPEDSIRIPRLEDEEKITIQPFTEKTPAEEQTDTAGPRGQQGRRDDSVRQTEADPRGAQASRDGDKTGEPRGPRGRHAGRGN